MRDRNSIKRKRQQQVRRQLFVIGVVIVLVIVMIASCAIKKSAKKKQEIKEAQKTEQVAENKQKKKKETTVKKEDVPETAEERLERVRKEAKDKGYPQAVINLLDKNPETVEYVENYEAKKDIAPPETIDNLVAGQIPFILQFDERWGYVPYGTGNIATAGCGPTCMSMIISGLTGDASVTPAVLAKFSEENNMLDEENNTFWSFMEASAENWNISCREGEHTKEVVETEIKAGNPIVCSVGPGLFTQTGHFIIITGYNDGVVNVIDPFSTEITGKTWVFDDFKDQIKCLWIFSYNG